MSRFLTVVAAAVAATVLAVVLASGGSAQAPGERTLTFTERNNLFTFKLVDNPPRSREGDRVSLGDMFVFATPLFDAANDLNSKEVCNGVSRFNAGRPGLFHAYAVYCRNDVPMAQTTA